MFNVWSSLLSGLVWFVQHVLMPLFVEADALGPAISFTTMIASNTGVVLQLMYWTLGSVVNLTLFEIWIGFFVVITLFKLGSSIYMLGKTHTPFAGGS